MHLHSLDQWQHDHDFNIDTTEGERRTRLVVILTACMMVVEIAAGYTFGSMALLADGWHMGTHVAALAISVFAYRYARRHADNPRYSFGTGKVSALGGFASAIALAVVALLMAIESVERLLAPQTIHFDEAILVAVDRPGRQPGECLAAAWRARARPWPPPRRPSRSWSPGSQPQSSLSSRACRCPDIPAGYSRPVYG